MNLSIIILSFNTKELLKNCLDSLIRAVGKINSSEIIVVDNASNDGSVELLKERLRGTKDNTRMRLIENKENLGYARGNNIGIKAAKGKYIMILNSDTEVGENSIKQIIDFLEGHPEIDIVGPRLLNADGSNQANCGRFPNLLVTAVMLFKEHFGGSAFVRNSPIDSKFVDWLMGAAFVARKVVFDKIGGFDEKIFMYMEEVEWFYRAKKAGFKAYFLKEAQIVHLGRGSSKSGRKEPILNIYRGLIHFYKKHFSFPELVVLLIMLKLKAAIALIIGWLKNDNYLKGTYGEAIKLA